MKSYISCALGMSYPFVQYSHALVDHPVSHVIVILVIR
jgi:hypothetical protein